HRVDLDFSFHVPVDDLGNVGAPARATERGAAPDPAGDELERACCDLLAGARDPNDDALAPPAMTGFERLAHDRDIAGAIEGVVRAADLVVAAFGHVDKVRHEIACEVFRVDEVRHAEPLAPRLLCRIDVDPDDHVGRGKPQPLDDIETDAAEAE